MSSRNSLHGFAVDRFLIRSTVAEVGQVTPRMRRIRLTSPRLANLPWTPGQQVRVLVGDWFALRGGFKDALRTYSVWSHDPAKCTVDLCVFDHGDGPGARWSRRVGVGDEVAFTAPEGTFVLHEADYHVFVGEETAQVPFDAMLRSLPQRSAVHGVIEVNQPVDRLALARASDLTWRYRDGAYAENSQSLINAVRALDLPDAPGFAYLAGEAKTCAAVRRHFSEERGWPARRSVAVKAFWTPRKRGLE
jgi:NADPH-dependent ferric siderophore reductase